ncbi:MAG: YjjG family noncanonical pyrimidine nucleotidase [Bacteriovorax sp.]|nr:YjjG family noncanonical pyrimidine nucleotidase [Bacteriovorax sp.]
MKYDLLLFDADDTLLDFKRSENISFQIILKKNGIIGDIEAFHESYKIINDLLWSQHAEGLVSKDFLKVERFRKFLEVNNLEADPIQLCDDYLETLPSQVFLIEGATELLKTLHGKIPLVIVTNGIGSVQHKRLLNSGLKPFIELMVISDECGFSKPDRRIFDYTFDLLNRSLLSSRTLMIGDRLETDILGARNIAMDSCWFNPDKFNNTTNISPTYEIQHIIDVLNIL